MITIGADPEVFLAKNGKVVSAIGKVGGTKENPKYLSDEIAVQEDNVLAEFNIAPCTSKIEFVNRIKHGLILLNEIANKKNCVIDIRASARFDNSQLRSSKARIFGCDPDYNAWTLLMNDPPSIDTNLRTAGGHIHVGMDSTRIIPTVRAMDLYIGVPSVLLDDDSERRMMYGKAGCFRHKKYGLEYRTVSNFWLKSDDLISWVWDNVISALIYAKTRVIDPCEKLGMDIVKCINENDKDIARSLIKDYNIAMP